MSRNDAELPPANSGPPQGRRARAARLSAQRNAAAVPSQPQFSQPVRQIVMMLVVLVLVIAGAWWTYGRILSIFSSNIALNGLILAVFVMGVLACFWQVAELVKSVSWIERFAARRGGGAGAAAALDAPDQAPRLLAPLAALLGQGGPQGTVLSTESARSILESVATRIDEARDITRYLANLLIFLGLLGTFYGLATTVPAVVDTIRALAPSDGETGIEVFNKLMTGLESQLGGMATAFSSSLLGLAGSLVVGLLELFATHGQNRFYRELEEWMSGFTRIGLAAAEGQGLAEAALMGFIDRMDRRLSALQDFYAERDQIRDEESSAADQRSLALARGVEELTALMGRERDALVSALEEQRSISAQALARLETAMEMRDRSAAPDHGPQILAVLERLAEIQTRMLEHAETARGTVPDQTNLAPALARLADAQDRLIDLTQSRGPTATDDPEARMRLRSIDVQLGRLVEEAAAGRDGLIAELRADMAALTRAIRRLEHGDGT